ncbi:hypothetical protein GWR56_17885 [Mucilaginibacter sp. 14171R-50]|uniref:hypothetical protein n=1 Tax=Mucilaginibacter sp. 14171R-50 TaxID=2703789 RepID=UPI00138DAB00|nr:hypothetical protein [Mucilaginibacter sp. 14171R-50]QHS57319.1 hypothetical protein GWR56_17885 [Mucilaginibacter sp. 14171R-50]
MKRFFALFLLSIHLFNTGGYSLISQYFIHRSEAQIVKQIYENKVDATQLVQIKVPLKSPGIVDWPDYERIQGQIQLKDGFYNYVGVKMTRDTMFLVCVANSVKTKLFNTNIIVAKNFSDAPLSKKGQDAPFKKAQSGVSEYDAPETSYTFLRFADSVERSDASVAYKLSHPYIESPGKPPNHIG